jgi:hypothetical protein
MKLKELLSVMKNVANEISVSEPKFCGGLPRDRFMGKLSNIADLDFTNGDKTIDYLSSEFFNQLKKKINVSRKVMDDGHSTIIIGNLKLDFSSNFNVPGIEKILVDKGISNPTEMMKEIYSRDFTCNALLLNLDLTDLEDPTEMGIVDIKNKKIKTCLSPEISLMNSRNRVVRGIYLACKLGFDLDKTIIEFVTKNPESIKISSTKVLTEKLNSAFDMDGDKAKFLLDKMSLWNYVPITEIMKPYYNDFAVGKNE